MFFLDPKVEQEFERWIALTGSQDPYATNVSLGIHDILRAHFLIIDFFSHERDGEGVGGVGPKDLNRLHSAVYRQFISFEGKEKWPSAFEKCATLVFGIVKDHPFHDANKRTGFLVLLYFLERLGRIPKIKQKEFENFIVDIVENKFDNYPRYRDLKKSCQDPDIQFIADYIKRNSRELDRRTYTVTFHELNQIIKPYGFELTNAKGNYIDVIKIEYKPKYLGLLGPQIRTETRIAQIGFPGWKRQVTRNALRTVRDATELTPKNGIDSQVFYQGADPLHALIDRYSEPLRRLADR